MTEPSRLWSVTTLIDQGLGSGPQICNWIAGTTAETAVRSRGTVASMIKEQGEDAAIDWLKGARWRTSGKAKARGSDLHTAAEKLALGAPVDVDVAILPYVEQYAKFLEEHAPTFLMSEAPVYSPTRHYAGTLDAIIELQGQRVVADIKSTEHGKDSGRYRPPYPEAALQLCAYRRAELVGVLSERRYAGGKRYYIFDPDGHHEPMPETDGAVVITVSPDDYYITPVRTDDEVFTAFLAVKEAARFRLDIGNRVFGPQITPHEEVAA